MKSFNTYIKQSFLLPVFVLGAIVVNAQDIADKDVKKNIAVMEDQLQKLMQLQPKKYEYNINNFKYLKLQKGKQYGFIAEEVEAVFPELVKQKSISYMYGKNVYRNATVKVVDEERLIPVLVAAIQEQQNEIEKLKAELLDMKKGMVSFNY
ncbi:MAG: tail fiber domain-containing protein [Chitinophagaceae bacterium]|nr:tail fiber domain-containing protein [Chitinophagaceae bacterium]